MPSITVGNGTLVEGIVHLYGASLGNGWSGMPSRMAPDYENTSPLQKLDLTLPVYIDWEISTYVMPGACAPCAAPNPGVVSPARALANEPWFIGHANDFIPSIVQSVQDGDYTTCASGRGLEEPVTTSLSPDGKMRVADIHGGISDNTAIYWVRYECVGSFCEYWFGFGRTGRDIVVVPGQPPVPEWTLVDREQNNRAILDPSGFRRGINAQQGVPWGSVKSLYR